MLLQEFLDCLKEVTSSGAGYTALCPAHDDQSPSLSVSQGNEDRILIKCHTGCSVGHIVEAMKLKMSDLFTNGRPNTSPSRKTVPANPIKEEEVAKLHADLPDKAREYLWRERMISHDVVNRYELGIEEQNGVRRITIPIKDESGNVRDIRRWLAPEKRNDKMPKILHWKKGYGAPRPFPMDQLEHNELVMVEGELDALASISHGIPAMTLTAGADTPPDQKTAGRFAGKTVTVLMDQDEAGRKGSWKRAEALVAHARDVKVASWPEDRSKGWDVTDELKKNGVESLKAILTTAILIKPEEPSSPTVDGVDHFPSSALPAPMQQLVDKGARAIQCAPDLIGVPLLAAAGAAIGTSRCLRLKTGWDEYPTLYAVPIAAPGQAKTPALNLALDPVHRQARRLRDQHQREKEEYESEYTRAKEDKRPLPEEPSTRRVEVSDATVEALAENLNENPRGLLLQRDELSGFAQSMNSYRSGKGADRQFFLSTWSGAPSSVDRKSQRAPLFLDRPFLAITGTIQPDCVRALLHDQKWDDGFIDRFLFSYPDMQPVPGWTEAVVDDYVKEAVNGHSAL